MALAVSAGLGVAAFGQTVRIETRSMLVQVEAQASSQETVRLLVGLGRIRADLQLGMLVLGEPSAAAHFGHPRAEILPGIAEGLQAAGVGDLAPVLQKLEDGGAEDAVRKAYLEAEKALLKARSTLAPSGEDAALAVLELARLSAGGIAASGPTEMRAYQVAWAQLMVARGELDLLARSADPGLAQLALSEAMALDEIILSMPDPAGSGPVAFDPAPILELVKRLERRDEAA
ncbi:hypothetical protein [Tabrizicola sp.]|uniref:hypothetical protein n=1 Tax=Tabrizicola sp. TaxID=2005166 RepID=UPI002FDEC3E8